MPVFGVNVAETKHTITDVSKCARTVSENLGNAALPKSRQKFNVSNPPLIPYHTTQQNRHRQFALISPCSRCIDKSANH